MARLNVQGLARRSPELVGCILPRPASKVVSMDLSAGEPTVTAHFSRDPNYLHATFEGVGKEPYWKNGVLLIDDIYLMTMSVSPIGRAAMEEAWRDSYDGLSFAKAWALSPDLVKSRLKKLREIHKMLALALGYGMGPTKMVKQCYDKGFNLALITAKDFYGNYWDLFAGIRRLAKTLQKRLKKDGYIINPFGYRLTPNAFKALNYFIQSTVSGIMHVFNLKLFTVAHYAEFISVIHDETLADCPIVNLEEFKRHKEEATASLNAELKWSVDIRTGWAIGDNWYEAK